MLWFEIVPGVYGNGITDPDKQRLLDLQGGGDATHEAYIAFTRDLARHNGPATMKNAGAQFLLALEGEEMTR